MNKFMKRLTISSVMQSMCYGFAALLLTASCTNDDTLQEGKQKKTDTPTGSTVFTGISQPEATTRTAILNHTKGVGASVNWSSSDRIWVKDDAGTWQQSATATIPSAANQSFAKFTLSGAYTGASHDIIYTNKAVTGSQPQVEIKVTQTQSAPNNFDHAGASGDCGIATGVKLGSGYNFTLNHKASYLCLIPRTNNEYVKRSKLIKVEIMSDDEIAGTYNMAADGTLTLASGGSKTITVTTGSGFAIDNTADDMSKNATYAVVAPGTHTFRIRYWLRNTTDNPWGTIEGTVSKIVTLNCTAGSIHDITANLDPHDYDGDKYYMWDAQQNYWAGHEWNSAAPWQPTLTSQPANPNYAQNNGDPRYYNEMYAYGAHNKAATHTSCKDLPNVNEMTWYAAKGEPRWDGDELWTTMGHLYKGGMWFKKKANISGYNPNTAVDGYDWRTYSIGRSWSVSHTLPDAADAGNYFYLPALGYYTSGKLNYVGFYGFYWSSSAYLGSSDNAYDLNFGSSGVGVMNGGRINGFRAEALFE
ncbi:hypothetical protein [Prevotella jejuni]